MTFARFTTLELARFQVKRFPHENIKAHNFNTSQSCFVGVVKGRKGRGKREEGKYRNQEIVICACSYLARKDQTHVIFISLMRNW
jgi:hypothetical protein